MKQCSNRHCGRATPAVANYCPSCGARVRKESGTWAVVLVVGFATGMLLVLLLALKTTTRHPSRPGHHYLHQPVVYQR